MNENQRLPYHPNTSEANSSDTMVSIEYCTTFVLREQPNLTFTVELTVVDVDLRVYSDDLNADGASINILNLQQSLMMEVQDINTIGWNGVFKW